MDPRRVDAKRVDHRDPAKMSARELRNLLQQYKLPWQDALERSELVQRAQSIGIFIDWTGWEPFPFEALPEEMAYYIFSYLGVKELCACSAVSKFFHRLAVDDAFWLPLCRVRWAKKQNLRLSKQREQEIAAKGLSWKQLYAQKEADKGRNLLSVEELCSLHWTFRFKHHIVEDDAEVPPLKAKWTAVDSTITVEHMGTMYWRWRPAPGMGIQVEHYPILEISRTPHNWGWQLENQHVIFLSYDEDEERERLEALAKQEVQKRAKRG